MHCQHIHNTHNILVGSLFSTNRICPCKFLDTAQCRHCGTTSPLHAFSLASSVGEIFLTLNTKMSSQKQLKPFNSWTTKRTQKIMLDPTNICRSFHKVYWLNQLDFKLHSFRLKLNLFAPYRRIFFFSFLEYEKKPNKCWKTKMRYLIPTCIFNIDGDWCGIRQISKTTLNQKKNEIHQQQYVLLNHKHY